MAGSFFRCRPESEIGLAAEALDTFSWRFSGFCPALSRPKRRSPSRSVPGSFAGSPDENPEATASRFYQLLDAVSVFKPETVVCHAGYDPTRYDFCRTTWCDHAVSAWRWLAKKSAGGKPPDAENVTMKNTRMS
ncbi:MAG: hypothetical protein R2861_10325 [Desulfobacterales bacterium]